MNLYKTFLFLLTIFIFFSGLTDAQLQILKIGNTGPVIDGQMDAIWDQAAIIPIIISMGPENPSDPSDFSAEARFLWNNNGIYIFISVNDDNISIVNTTHWYENDAMSVFIDGGNEKNTAFDGNDFQFSYQLHDTELANSATYVPNSQFISYETEHGYNYEAYLAAGDLNDVAGMNLTAGTEFGIDIEVIDNDFGEGRDHLLVYYSTIVNYWENPRFWGTAVLVETFARMQIPKTNIAPVIDGEMDMIWNYAAVDSIKNHTNEFSPGTTRQDFSAEYRMLWDNNNIYIFTSVTDDNIRIDYTDDISNWWRNDGTAIYFDFGNEKNAAYDNNDIQFAYITNDPGLSAIYNPNYDIPIDNFSHCQFVTHETENGYNYEIRISRADLSLEFGILLNVGLEFGWETEINDNDSGDRDLRLNWCCTDADYWNNPSRWKTARLTDYFLYPNSVNVIHTLDFPVKSEGSDYKPEDYRIIGLPGNNEVLIGSLFNGKQDEDWQVYWDNGEESDFFVEYNESETFSCITGRAFWVLNKGSLNIDLNRIEPAPINYNAETYIELHPRWNLITNPFPVPINWEQVQTLNDITVPIWSFDGSLNDDNQFLEPYKGYYFDNMDQMDLELLRIPYFIEDPYMEKPVTDNHQWEVTIILKCGDFIDKTTHIAVNENAKSGLDRYEFCKPRVLPEIPQICFNRPEWDKSYPSFANDVRPLFQEIESWDFTIQTVSYEQMNLSFSGIDDIPEHFSVYLINHTNSSYINLRENNSCDFLPLMKNSSFTITVGREEMIEEKLAQVIPDVFSLSQNFPNPFNPRTTIPFALPSQAEVTIKIYNIMGQQVNELVSETFDAGKHHVSWDGKDNQGNRVASGVYVIRMSTNAGKHFSGKMLLLK